MPDANDMDLVREFARDHSAAAFNDLVRRHLNLVYSVARRCTGNDGDAHDVTQAVFIILARKAAGLRKKPCSPAGSMKPRGSPPPGCSAPTPAATRANRRLICNPL